MFNVVFVCTGNTCRSSMAEGIAKSIAGRYGDRAQHVKFKSAGVAAFPGSPASTQAIQVLREKHIDLLQHRASLLDDAVINNADLILVMTAAHKQAVLQRYPELVDKVFLLSEYVLGQKIEVADPFGQSVEIYRMCADQLEALIAQLVRKLVN